MQGPADFTQVISQVGARNAADGVDSRVRIAFANKAMWYKRLRTSTWVPDKAWPWVASKRVSGWGQRGLPGTSHACTQRAPAPMQIARPVTGGIRH